jgi:GNAT superfamily N-acetyltransferase
VAHADGRRLSADPALRVVPDRIDSEIGAMLAGELLVDLAARYGSDDIENPRPEELAPPHGSFFVVWRADTPVGCGGVRRHADGVGEIKRMYTRPEARRSGVGRILVNAIEARAREIGYARLVLETATEQPEAIELYRALGYEPMDAYGAYLEYPNTRCFTKTL